MNPLWKLVKVFQRFIYLWKFEPQKDLTLSSLLDSCALEWFSSVLSCHTWHHHSPMFVYRFLKERKNCGE